MSGVRPFAELELELRTQRLVLRPLQPSDLDALWPFVSDPDLPYFMTWEPHRERERTVEFLRYVMDARRKETGIVWAITWEGALIGVIGLEGIRRVLGAWQLDVGEIGYWLGDEYRECGFMTEAIREVMRFAFEDLRLHKITVGHVTENVASRRVVEKAGFRFLGEKRDHLYRHGRWWNHRDYELLEREWRDR